MSFSAEYSVPKHQLNEQKNKKDNQTHTLSVNQLRQFPGLAPFSDTEAEAIIMALEQFSLYTYQLFNEKDA